MPRRERNDDDAAAPALHFLRADDSGLVVVAALRDDVRTKRSDELERSVFIEDHDAIDAFERGNDEGTIDLGADRARRTLQPPGGIVAVDADDQGITFRSRGSEHVDVTGMKKIEHAVREHDRAAGRITPLLRGGAAHHLRGGLTYGQKFFSDDGWK